MEVGGSNWQDHELLHGQFVSSMATTINHIKGLQKEKDSKNTIHMQTTQT